MEKKENGFYFVYKTDEDIKLENIKIASELREDQKTNFIFNREHLYELGRGHAFGMGFFTKFITKSAITATRYDSGKWHINSDEYVYENDTFVLVPPYLPTNEPIDFSNLVFPVVKNISTKTIGDDIQPEYPKLSNKD